MTVEAITFDKNGQGVINFEALELITTKEFADKVNFHLEYENMYFHSHRINEFGDMSIFLHEKEYGLIILLKYWNFSQKYDSMHISYLDVHSLVEIMNSLSEVQSNDKKDS